MNRITYLLLFAVLALGFGNSVLSAEEPVSTGRWNGLALNGYDSTSYSELRSQNRAEAKAPVPAAGNRKYAFSYKGVDWVFASQADRDRFAADPLRYQPEFNGFCANALGEGKGLVRTNGKIWYFFGDKLYLFYNEGGRKAWLQDWEEQLPKARSEWRRLTTAAE